MISRPVRSAIHFPTHLELSLRYHESHIQEDNSSKRSGWDSHIPQPRGAGKGSKGKAGFIVGTVTPIDPFTTV